MACWAVNLPGERKLLRCYFAPSKPACRSCYNRAVNVLNVAIRRAKRGLSVDENQSSRLVTSGSCSDSKAEPCGSCCDAFARPAQNNLILTERFHLILSPVHGAHGIDRHENCSDEQKAPKESKGINLNRHGRYGMEWLVPTVPAE
jgi:hypothetical protein